MGKARLLRLSVSDICCWVHAGFMADLLLSACTVFRSLQKATLETQSQGARCLPALVPIAISREMQETEAAFIKHIGHWSKKAYHVA